MNINLVGELDISDTPGDHLRFGDVDGDGSVEICILQLAHSSAAQQDEAPCMHLACVRPDGSFLWKHGAAWSQERPYWWHGAAGFFLFDPHLSGKQCLAINVNEELSVFDGSTGRRLAETRLRGDRVYLSALQRLASGETRLVYNQACSRGAKIMGVLEADLGEVWRREDVPSGGHITVCRDVDGDGDQEIFWGYSLFGRDGRIRWTFDWPSHADDIKIGDINDDGIDEVVYCTDDLDLFIATIHGELLHTISDFPHPQKSTLGEFMPGLPGRQIFMNNRATHGGSCMMDSAGAVLWEFPCQGYSTLLPMGAGEPDAILVRPNPGRPPQDVRRQLAARARELGYEDLPIDGNEGFEPIVLSGTGEIIGRFPRVVDAIDTARWGIEPQHKCDYGAGFGTDIVDIDGDGVDEVVVHTRTHVWIYRVEG